MAHAIIGVDRSEIALYVRTIAADWHNGIDCPLYAYVSTGSVVEGLVEELRKLVALSDVTVHGEKAIDQLAFLWNHIEEFVKSAKA